jgi:hypothetical protein
MRRQHLGHLRVARSGADLFAEILGGGLVRFLVNQQVVEGEAEPEPAAAPARLVFRSRSSAGSESNTARWRRSLCGTPALCRLGNQWADRRGHRR